mmetsp:Transcript_15844/g.25373  ORF Transcript_15844/g.25373 Transcript_15844/m.25373 type:complete len:109 (+) Transcript_15844:63-389(+)
MCACAFECVREYENFLVQLNSGAKSLEEIWKRRFSVRKKGHLIEAGRGEFIPWNAGMTTNVTYKYTKGQHTHSLARARQQLTRIKQHLTQRRAHVERQKALGKRLYLI